MPIKDIYVMSDEAISAEVGQRIEQLRLEANMTQETIATELGITRKTYRSAINGVGKFSTVIGILRILGRLELMEEFVPETPYSPIELMKMRGRKRRRATGGFSAKTSKHDEDPGW